MVRAAHPPPQQRSGSSRAEGTSELDAHIGDLGRKRWTSYGQRYKNHAGRLRGRAQDWLMARGGAGEWAGPQGTRTQDDLTATGRLPLPVSPSRGAAGAPVALLSLLPVLRPHLAGLPSGPLTFLPPGSLAVGSWNYAPSKITHLGERQF